MHVENELAEIMTIREHEFEEVIEECEEEVLEPPLTDWADTAPAQGKPRWITFILNDHWIYICDVHLRYMIYIETTCIDKPTWVLLA